MQYKEIMIIQLFGIAKDIVGSNNLAIDNAEEITTVKALKVWLAQRYPALQQLKSMAVAVDSEYANDEQAIAASSEVALIPPVSGG